MIGDILDTVSMYLFTLSGVLVSKYMPMFRAGGDIVIEYSIGQLIMSCVVAFMLLTAAEQMGGKNRQGKRKRYLWRAIAAMTYGAFWYNIIGG